MKKSKDLNKKMVKQCAFILSLFWFESWCNWTEVVFAYYQFTHNQAHHLTVLIIELLMVCHQHYFLIA